jgi:hypothetical protein
VVGHLRRLSTRRSSGAILEAEPRWLPSFGPRLERYRHFARRTPVMAIPSLAQFKTQTTYKTKNPLKVVTDTM